MPVQQVAGITQLSAEDPLEEFTKNRTWFCTLFSPYYDLCHEGTQIPVWCDNNATEIFCPDEPGYEYDPVTGEGGSSGGGGAGRTWDVEKCLDVNKNIIPCPTQTKYANKCYGDWMVSSKTNQPYDDCNLYIDCFSLDGVQVNCNMAQGTFSKEPSGTLFFEYHTNTSLRQCTSWTSQQGGRLTPAYDSDGYYVSKCYVKVTVGDTTYNPTTQGFKISPDMTLINPKTRLPVEDENTTGGLPNYIAPPPPPPDPLDVEVPAGNEECGAICTWLSYIYNVMRVVNQSVLKVDSSIQEMVSNMTPKTDLFGKLDDIISAIDKVSFEIVKEAETNFWDVLGDGLGDIFDFVEFLIEKVIYLVIPEDTSNITTSFSNLSDTLNQKIKPVTDMKNTITSAVTVEDKEFENIEINLPRYGVVPFLKVDYLLMAIPYVRQMLGGSMILMTAIWAYRKVSSEMVK